MEETNEKITNQQAVDMLRQAVVQRAAARKRYESANRDYVDVIVAVLTRIRKDRGMTWRQMQRLAPRPGGGYFTFQYLNQVINGTPPSDGLVKALIRGLEEDGT